MGAQLSHMLTETADSLAKSRIASNAIVTHNPDFMAMAKAYEAGVQMPGTLAELVRAIPGAFEADGTSVFRVTPDIRSGQAERNFIPTTLKSRVKKKARGMPAPSLFQQWTGVNPSN